MSGAVPGLFDAYEVQLEQLMMSDALFLFLLMSAATVALWREKMTWRAGIGAGLLLALAGLTRIIGLPLVVLLVLFLLVRRVGWRTGRRRRGPPRSRSLGTRCGSSPRRVTSRSRTRMGSSCGAVRPRSPTAQRSSRRLIWP
jgi:hypothetical protein